MIVSIKDGVKLFVLAVVSFCAVFVCTFFINYYLDTSKITVADEILSLYKSQRAMAKFTCLLTGLSLALISAVILFFYIKIYVDEHSETIGVLKAMGYSNARLGLSFTVFGASVFIGCAAGFALAFSLMRPIYDSLTIEGMPKVEINFRVTLFLGLAVLPALVFGGLSYLISQIALKKPPLQMMRGRTETKVKPCKNTKGSFLIQMSKGVLSSKKLVVFFVAFSCFCFSSMLQMGMAMLDMDSGGMATVVMIIGVILAFVSLYMSVTTAVNANRDSVALMKAFGYSGAARTLSVFGGYIPFGIFGFAIGTIYQHFLLKIMIGLIYEDSVVYAFKFEFTAITLGAFVILYAAVFAYFIYKLNRQTLRRIDG